MVLLFDRKEKRHQECESATIISKAPLSEPKAPLRKGIFAKAPL
jgi:hypothetical protein